ncbi:trafficking protein particle complex subunit 5-like [Plakobranchus ocellatus]|uniref:Trafficking protein particle complex subunit 5-like n=1 Tax=Plakobranchus ocellatus TaxID=259542 RepID=A0AAV3YEI8_9GAST|nr:trafficking protein particle complex subunit 5-like [Plakobranchus ocellatus]
MPDPGPAFVYFPQTPFPLPTVTFLKILNKTPDYIIEKEPLVNKFISVPRDKGSLNCAAFTAGILEAVLNGANFPAKVTVHWHKGTTFMIKFDESVIARDKMVDSR